MHNMSMIHNIGTPPQESNCWSCNEFRFHNFADLTYRGYRTPNFECLGHRWIVILWPHGHSNQGTSVFLWCRGNDDKDDSGTDGLPITHDDDYGDEDIERAPLELINSIDIDFGITIRDSNGKEVVNRVSKFDPRLPDDTDPEWENYDTYGWQIFSPREKLLDACVNGSLIVEVRMKERNPVVTLPPPEYVHNNPISKNILKLFGDEDTADVVFEVSTTSMSDNEDTHKRSKTVVTYHAHRIILQDGAPFLAELSKAVSSSGVVQINDVTHDVFKHVLFYAYGGKIIEDDMKTNTKEIINAADKYGVVHLKLEAEEYYTEATTLTINNVLDNLLYADSKNLALMKEAVMDFILVNGDDVMDKVSFDNVPGAVVKDLLAAVARGKAKSSSDTDNYNNMRVATLRKLLDEKGLEVDGSRESMIALLKKNTDQDNDDGNDD